MNENIDLDDLLHDSIDKLKVKKINLPSGNFGNILFEIDRDTFLEEYEFYNGYNSEDDMVVNKNTQIVYRFYFEQYKIKLLEIGHKHVLDGFSKFKGVLAKEIMRERKLRKTINLEFQKINKNKL